MSEVYRQILELERQIENAQAVIVQRDMVDRLANNRDFQKLIIEGFMRDECARLTHMSTDPNLSAQDRLDALGSAQAPGYLKRWLNALVQMGNNAERDLPEARATLEELRADPDGLEA